MRLIVGLAPTHELASAGPRAPIGTDRGAERSWGAWEEGLFLDAAR
jgi:hypothetical protein